MPTIVESLKNIRERIVKAENTFNREPGSVKLVGVTKRQSMEKMQLAADQGLRDFGENYLQEALLKLSHFNSYHIQWHFIGPIQSNKTQDIACYFDWVHSIDRAKIALRLSEQRPEHLEPMNVLVQINVDNEDPKSGINFEELPAIAELIAGLPRIKLRGLMAIPAIRQEFEEQREPFKRLRDMFEKLKQDGHPEIDTLSMGMSHDFEAAIAEGSTMVRIGSAIFGDRN